MAPIPSTWLPKPWAARVPSVSVRGFGEAEGGDGLVAQFEPIRAGSVLAKKLERFETPARHAGHAPGARLIEFGFTQGVLGSEAMPLGERKILFRLACLG